MKHSSRLRIIKIVFAVIIVLLLFVPASVNHPQIDMRALVAALGIDASQNEGEIEVSAEIILPVAGGGSVGSSQVISGSGKTLPEALNGIGISLGRSLELNHCGIVVLGMDYAQNGVTEELEYLLSSGIVCPEINLTVSANETANEFLQALSEYSQKLDLSNLLRYTDLGVQNYSCSLTRFLRDCRSNSGASAMPCFKMGYRAENSRDSDTNLKESLNESEKTADKTLKTASAGDVVATRNDKTTDIKTIKKQDATTAKEGKTRGTKAAEKQGAETVKDDKAGKASGNFYNSKTAGMGNDTVGIFDNEDGKIDKPDKAANSASEKLVEPVNQKSKNSASISTDSSAASSGGKTAKAADAKTATPDNKPADSNSLKSSDGNSAKSTGGSSVKSGKENSAKAAGGADKGDKPDKTNKAESKGAAGDEQSSDKKQVLVESAKMTAVFKRENNTAVLKQVLAEEQTFGLAWLDKRTKKGYVFVDSLTVDGETVYNIPLIINGKKIKRHIDSDGDKTSFVINVSAKLSIQDRHALNAFGNLKNGVIPKNVKDTLSKEAGKVIADAVTKAYQSAKESGTDIMLIEDMFFRCRHKEYKALKDKDYDFLNNTEFVVNCDVVIN